MGAPLVGTAPIFAISFYSNALGKKMQQGSREEVLGPAQLALAGGFSGVMTTIVMAPGERIKCLLQVSPDRQTDRLYSSLSQLVVSCAQYEGCEDKSALHICVSSKLCAVKY